jgi:hypothetical protein
MERLTLLEEDASITSEQFLSWHGSDFGPGILSGSLHGWPRITGWRLR